MRSFFAFLSLFFSLSAFSQSLYFPPKTGNVWETTAPASLGFCSERIDSLYQFLSENETKGFVLLKNGRIVLEKYFAPFTQDSAWYWASAGKTCSAALVGIAEKEGILNIDQKTSDFLGAGWTSCTAAQEEKITIRHQITMTTGLDDSVEMTSGNLNCAVPTCFLYKADAGTRWAYHTSAYLMTQKVLENSSGQTINAFSKARLFDKIGMKALWLNGVLFSRPRDMARFGLFLLNKGQWAADPALLEPTFFAEMTSSSQSLNKSYGYLTWLNGQGSFMLPGLQFVFPTNLMPSAPSDAFMALGKNDQKIHVVPSQGLVVVRMGNAASVGSGNVPIAFDEVMWQKINALVCAPSATETVENTSFSALSPNPSDGLFAFENNRKWSKIEIFDAAGRFQKRILEGQNISLEGLAAGLYFFKIEALEGRVFIQKAIKN